MRAALLAGAAAVCHATAPLESPFAFLHNQIVLTASAGGEGPLNFILDTGTRDSVVDEGVAERLALALGASTQVTGAGSGRATGRTATLPELRIGELSVAKLRVTVIDLSGISRSLGRHLDGVLGFGFLEQRILQIDYFHRSIRFLTEFAPPGDSESGYSFAMQFGAESVLPVLDQFYVNGRRLPVTLDTGSSLGLTLFPRAVKALGLESYASEGAALQASGYLGEVQMAKGWVTSARLGSVDLGAIETAYVKRGLGDREDPERRGGNLGNALLQDFLVTLDYRNRLVTIERPAN